MPGQVTESIFNGKSTIIPYADVQHIYRLSGNDIWVITKHTKWNMDVDTWDNPIYLQGDEAIAFTAAWCQYRSELEADTLKDIRPDA